MVPVLAMLLPSVLSAQIHNFPWPISPMNQQHRISATFDECRENRDHFHSGTDLPLAPGGQVLSIMGGQVTGIGSDWIRVEDFAYVHVNHNPALQVGNSVSQGAVVGWTDSYAHIHLNYGGGASGHPSGNPLLPNGFVPFNDPYHPRSPIIQFVLDGTFSQFPSSSISGRVDIVAQAADTTDMWSSIDMNNGIYTIGWALYSSDTNTVLAGPHFWFEADQLYSNSYINNVYAPGSSTSIYKYIVTNRISANGFLDCDLYEPGPYVVSVMSSDTRDNWDTTFVRVNISDVDLLPPGQPVLNYVGPDVNGDLYFEWSSPGDPDLAGYILEFSFNGSDWSSNHGPDVLTADLTSFVVPNFPENAIIKFRLIAVDAAPIPNRSEPSDSYGVRLNSSAPSVLIVDGFDRTNGSWTQNHHDFACYYSDAVVNSGLESSISTVSNEWVIQTQNLNDYQTVLWFTGDESRTDETFNTAEQNIISNYLTNGGNFFASGAEIGYDLSAGSTGDQAFLNQVLHVNYAGDNAGNMHVNGVGAHFSGISFDYGATPYIEDWPDYFTPSSSGEIALQYGNSLVAAVSYRDDTSASFVMGFPFETIELTASRADLLERVFLYFARMNSIDESQVPLSFCVSAIYPNPFNASINIGYSLDQSGEVDLLIYNISGREVYHHNFGSQSAGSYTHQWSATDIRGKTLASGTYLVRINQSGRWSATRKLLLLK
ncbi:MAG: T9SS type A sorting domain-containing protein [Candidatus Marinimicrobia bacterium]|nr:T9SS type A sorting domain-containing protein [Candidatus Neomarinimicrobiota bacterium]